MQQRPWDVLGRHGTLLRARPPAIGLLMLACCLLLLLLQGGRAWALEPIVIEPGQKKIDITLKGELYQGRGDELQIETAPGSDGITGRMVVSATTRGTNPNWVVFALKNPTDKRVERWLTADRYTLAGSKVFWPDLDATRLVNVTPSIGFRPDRVRNKKADIFKLSLEPGTTVTFVAELSTMRFPRLYLWRANPYINHRYDTTLFSGILLGITGILAIFLTTIFAANHQAIFPATATLAWAILAYLCVDFGFWHKLFNLNIEDNAIYRAASEAAIAAAFIVFLYAFLRLSLWHRWIKFVFAIWLLAQLFLIPLAVLDASLASGLARLSYVGVIGAGGLLIAYLALNGQERALSLLPTWLLFAVWIFAVYVTVEGLLSGEIIVSALNAGLVLILALLTFTATQFAFRGSDSELTFGAPRSQLQLRALAIEGADSAVWEWQPRRDEISVSHEVEDALGLSWGTLTTRVKDWLKYLHQADRERFRLMLTGLEERNGGDIDIEFRMRRSDGIYLWFGLKAHSIDSGQSRSLRCVGLMRDITDAKHAQKRLMYDAVHDSLTGLPNRALFLDRLATAVTRVIEENATNPTLMFIDIDRFKNVNKSYGLMVGDSMLLAVARKLARHLKPQDTLARIGGDQFGILVVTESNPQNIAMLAERIRRALRSPMTIGSDEIILTSSIGIAIYDGRQKNAEDLFREAELAMYSAKRSGSDRIELFNPKLTEGRDDRMLFESELRRSLQRNQMKVSYQPIMRLGTNELAGFEALLRWDHPKFGIVNPVEFIPVAEESGLIGELGAFVLEQAVRAVRVWHDLLPRSENPLFVSVNVSSRQIFRRELVQDIRHILGRQSIPPGTLRLEITESLVMENPEQAAEILDWLRSLGASLSLDDFGTGYSSLAYLHRLPFDTIKIDRSLVQNRGMNPSGLAILRAVVALAHELDKDVVAEGVEFEEDVTFLRSINCDYAQGYHFGEPIGEREVAGVLEALARNTRSQESRKLSARKQPHAKAESSAGASRKGAPSPSPAGQPPAGKGAAPAAAMPPTSPPPQTSATGPVAQAATSPEPAPAKVTAGQMAAAPATSPRGNAFSQTAQQMPPQPADITAPSPTMPEGGTVTDGKTVPPSASPLPQPQSTGRVPPASTPGPYPPSPQATQAGTTMPAGHSGRQGDPATTAPPRPGTPTETARPAVAAHAEKAKNMDRAEGVSRTDEKVLNGRARSTPPQAPGQQAPTAPETPAAPAAARKVSAARKNGAPSRPAPVGTTSPDIAEAAKKISLAALAKSRPGGPGPTSGKKENR